MEETELNQKSEESVSRRVAKVPVSLTLLEQMLPMGSKILGANFNQAYGIVEVVIAHPSFDSLNDGDSIPTKTLMAYRTFCKEGNHSYVSKVDYAS